MKPIIKGGGPNFALEVATARVRRLITCFVYLLRYEAVSEALNLFPRPLTRFAMLITSFESSYKR